MGNKQPVVASEPTVILEPDILDEPRFVLDESQRARKLSDFFTTDEPTLGEGHYGIVQTTTRLCDGETFALKTVRKKKSSYISVLKTEISILERVDHPSIIKLIDKFEDDTHVYLVCSLSVCMLIA